MTARTLPSSSTWQDVLWDGSKFVAIGYTTATSLGAYATSTDGATWTGGTIAASGSNWEYTCVAYNGTNQYVALIGGNGGTNDIATSTNGTTWSTTANALPANSFWKQVIWDGSKYVAIRADSANIATSSNGTTWTGSAVSGGSSDATSIAVGAIGATTYYPLLKQGGFFCGHDYSALESVHRAVDDNKALFLDQACTSAERPLFASHCIVERFC